MARRRSSTVRIDEGFSAKYWFTVAGYVAAGVLLLIAVVVSVLQSQGDAYTGEFAASMVGLFLFAFSVGGVLTYPAIFKDASYLRSTGGYWKPDWWYYIGAGLGIPIALIIALSAFQAAVFGIVGAIFLHALTAFIVNALYLYRRHDRVGVP